MGGRWMCILINYERHIASNSILKFAIMLTLIINDTPTWIIDRWHCRGRTTFHELDATATLKLRSDGMSTRGRGLRRTRCAKYCRWWRYAIEMNEILTSRFRFAIFNKWHRRAHKPIHRHADEIDYSAQQMAPGDSRDERAAVSGARPVTIIDCAHSRAWNNK